MSAEVRALRGELAELLAKIDQALDAREAALGAPINVHFEGATLPDPTAPPAAGAISAEDAALVAELEADEGVRRSAYQDSLGFWTIGRGRLIDARRGGGLSPDEIDYLTANDLRRVDGELDRHLPWWRRLDAVRRRALRNLMFNMGWGDGKHGLSTFVNTMAALEAGDFGKAADGLATSAWARQVQPSRSSRIIRQIRTGA